MEDGSTGEQQNKEQLAPSQGSIGDGERDALTRIHRGQWETGSGNDVGQHRSFSETRSPVCGMTSWTHRCALLYTSTADTDCLDVCRRKIKENCVSLHSACQRSHSLDNLSSSDILDDNVCAFKVSKIHGVDPACPKLQVELSSDKSKSINSVDDELCELSGEDMSASIVRQRSPSWVLLEHPDCITDCDTSAFGDNYTPLVVTDTHERSHDRLDVYSCQTDNLSLDHLSLHVGSSRGDKENANDISSANGGQHSCPEEGDPCGTSSRESPTGDAYTWSSPQKDCVELFYTGNSSEGSVHDGSMTTSPECAADGSAACAGATPTEMSPAEDTSSTESLYDSLNDYNAVIPDTPNTNSITPRCSIGVKHSSRDQFTCDNVCSPSCCSGAVSHTEPAISTDTEPFVSPVTICNDTLRWVSVKRRPNSLQITPMYVHRVFPPAVESRSDHETEEAPSQTHRRNGSKPILGDTEVPQCDDRSSTSSNQTHSTNRYSWPASQSVQLRSRSCSRLRRKHVKSAASFLTSAADLSGSTSTGGLSRRFHSQQLSLTKSASLGHGIYQNARWGCPTSARLNDSRKSEKFIMSLKKDGMLKPRTQQRCRHKRHSYHVTTGPCVTCTNHSNSLGPCFVLGVGQCSLCKDCGHNIDSKKKIDHPLVQLEYVMPKLRGKTGEEKMKVAETVDSAVRTEMEQYTREKLGQRSREDLVVLVEHFSRQARVVSEELVRLLQEKHDFIEQIEMRKVAIEQLLRLQMETK